MSKIQKVKIQKVLGFRSSETIRVSVFDEVGESASAFVAFGKSEGKYEAKYLDPNQATLKSEELGVLLEDFDIFDQAGIDKKMIETDGTFQKENLGGNVMLGTSIACAKLAAKLQKKQLFMYLADLFGGKAVAYKPPKILFNIIEGGVHAENNLPIQEHLLISQELSVKDQITALDKVFDSLSQKFSKDVVFGDEGGFATPKLSIEAGDNVFQAEDIAFNFLKEYLQPGDNFGVDAAANNIKNFDPEKYQAYYQKLMQTYPLGYIEDPFPEEGFDEYWKKLYATAGGKALVVGDDLTVTNPKKLEGILSKKMINGIIIKPDQVGTLTETFETIKLARENGLRIAVSHRSQETNDDYLADLACAVNADFVKFGAFYQGERLAKYNRLLEIESLLKK